MLKSLYIVTLCLDRVHARVTIYCDFVYIDRVHTVLVTIYCDFVYRQGSLVQC